MLDGTDQLNAVVRKYRGKLRYLGVSQHVKGGIRQGEVLDFDRLTGLSELQGLYVGYIAKTSNESAVEKLTKLKFLHFDIQLNEDIDLSKLPHLEELRCLGSSRLQSLWTCKSLKKLWIDSPINRDITQAATLENLESIEVSKSRRFVSLAGIEKLPKLRYLGLYYLTNLTELASIGDAQSLEYLVIEGCSKLYDIDALHDLSNLKYLEIRGCRALKSMTPFRENPNTTHVFFMEENGLSQPIEELVRDLPNLQYYYG